MEAQTPDRVSLVVTVLNEARSIGTLLASIDDQVRPPDEVVIVDGGSTDGTLDLLNVWAGGRPNVRIQSAPGASISVGRNLGIRSSSSEIIAVTDAGVALDPQWLQNLAAAINGHPEVDVACGFFVPERTSLFDRAMGATLLPAVEDVDGSTFLPSSRSVAFRRSAWERVGGYPEWLDYCEDLVFDMAMKDSGMQFVWVPEAIVRFKTRSTLRSFFLQYFRYARGDGKADLWRKRHALRYGVYACAAILAIKPSALGALAAILGGVWYVRRPIERFLGLGPTDVSGMLGALFLIPLIRLTGDVAKMAGYPVGWAWRMAHSSEQRP